MSIYFSCPGSASVTAEFDNSIAPMGVSRHDYEVKLLADFLAWYGYGLSKGYVRSPKKIEFRVQNTFYYCNSNRGLRPCTKIVVFVTGHDFGRGRPDKFEEEIRYYSNGLRKRDFKEVA